MRLWTIQLTTYLLYQLFLLLLADIVDLRFALTWVRTITYYYLQMGFGVEVGRKEAVASDTSGYCHMSTNYLIV